MTNTEQEKKHIFISYAWEDHLFAHWLAKMLTRYGYYVWIDKLKLLGGEPFPQEIESGISNSAFFLAIMSRSSKDKESPRRERTLASKEAKKREQSDFTIPIICDDLSPNDLDFVTTELTALIFTDNWAKGLTALLEKLQKSSLETEPEAGLSFLSSLNVETVFKNESETLVSNFIQVKEIPKLISGFEKYKIDQIWMAKNKGFYYEQDNYIWCFEKPEFSTQFPYEEKYQVLVSEQNVVNGIKPQDVLIFLIDRYVRRHLISRGLKQEWRDLYFPIGLLPNDKISYQGFSGRKTSVKVSGIVTSGYRNNSPIQFRYYLAPDFHIVLDRFSQPYLRLIIKIRVSDLDGRTFPPDKALVRRKKTVKSWFNRQWINRYYGITAWLTEGQDVEIYSGDNGKIVLDSKLREFDSCIAIDEEKIGAKLDGESSDDDSEET